jgi:hypothetical protein
MAPRTRADFHAILQGIVGAENKVYFQPPEKSKMTYPCIVYSLADLDSEYADDIPYSIKIKYRVILIQELPVGAAIMSLAKLEASRFQSSYISDNLNHYAYSIYY